MSSHINNLLRQAVTTFGSVKEVIPQNVEALKYLLDRTSPSDIGFKDHVLLKPDIWRKTGKAPITYVDIYEDDILTIGVFVISPNMKLPLHNHPCMHGLIKVIGGTVKINSYTVTEENGKSVVAHIHNPLIVSNADSSCILGPLRENLHEIESVNGPAAFLDILAPPYDTQIPNGGTRKCTYFAPVKFLAEDSILLKKIKCPSWFTTDCYPYEGPRILDSIFFREDNNI